MKRAFTIIELLVVMAIIAILLALLMPVLARARYEARLTVCAARQRDFANALHAYATDNGDYFPRQDLYSGQDAWDVALSFRTVLMQHYGLLHSSFFCPDDLSTLQDGVWNFGSFMVMGWSYWVPREISGSIIPPIPGQPGFVVPGTMALRAPTKLGDANPGQNPLLTDSIITNPSGPPNVDLSIDSSALIAPDGYAWTPHRWNGALGAIDATYPDTHVDRVPGKSVIARYEAAYWNWR